MSHKRNSRINKCLKLKDKKVEIIPILANELTEEQINEFQRAFALFDNDNDGKITVREMTLVMKAIGQNPSPKEISDMISSVDVDHNGTIEFPEFLVLMANKLDRDNPSEEVQKALRIFDTDNDGYLKSHEMKNMLENYGEKMTAEEIEEFLAIADKNGDGLINYCDFASKLELDPS